MVKLPGPEEFGGNRTSRDPGLSSRAVAGVAAGTKALGQGFQNLGEAAFDISVNVRQQRQEAEDNAFLTHVNAESRRQFSGVFEEQKLTATEGAENFTSVLDEALLGTSSSLVDDARTNGGFRPTEGAMTQAVLRQEELRANFGVRATVYENNERIGKLTRDLDQSLDSLAMSAFDAPDDLETIIEEGQDAVERAAGLIPAAQLDVMRDKVRQGATRAAVMGLIRNRPGEALNALEAGEFDDGLTPENKLRLINRADKVLETETVKAASQAASDTIMALGLTEIDALDQASEISNSKVREETEQRIRRSYQDIQRGNLANERALYESAWEIIEPGGTPDDFTPEMRVALGSKLALFWAASGLDRARGGPDNDEVYWNLKGQLGSNRTAFADVNLNDPEIKGQLSQKRWDELKEEQVSIQSGDTVGSARVQTNNQIVNSAIAEMGIKTGSKAGTDDIAKANDFRNWIAGNIEVFEQTNGRKPTETEVREIVSRGTIQVVSDPGFFSFETKFRGFELGDMTPEQAEALEVPDADRELILQAYFDRNGLDAEPLSEEKIRDAYLWKVTGGE